MVRTATITVEYVQIYHWSHNHQTEHRYHFNHQTTLLIGVQPEYDQICFRHTTHWRLNTTNNRLEHQNSYTEIAPAPEPNAHPAHIELPSHVQLTPRRETRPRSRSTDHNLRRRRTRTRTPPRPPIVRPKPPQPPPRQPYNIPTRSDTLQLNSTPHTPKPKQDTFFPTRSDTLQLTCTPNTEQTTTPKSKPPAKPNAKPPAKPAPKPAQDDPTDSSDTSSDSSTPAVKVIPGQQK